MAKAVSWTRQTTRKIKTKSGGTKLVRVLPHLNRLKPKKK